MSHLTLLRSVIKKQNQDGFILPVNDEFMGEYVPASARRLEWLTGFTGSAGLAVVLQDKAAFFTDGRYTLQAKNQVKDFDLYNSGDVSPEEWIAKHTREGAIISYDPKLHTLRSVRRFEDVVPRVTWHPVAINPIDELWQKRPASPSSKVRIQKMEYAGESSKDKRARIAKLIVEKRGDAAILTAPDSICWLLNIRGNDVPFTPFLLCYAVLEKTGDMVVYIDETRVSKEVAAHFGKGVTVKSPKAMLADFRQMQGKKILYDSANSPAWFYFQLIKVEAKIIEAGDPCHLPKACKNEKELEGMRQAHIRDGFAVTRFLYWLDDALKNKQKLTEIVVAEKLESFRKQSSLYLEPSFSTIAGSGPNGAIVHYHATKESNSPIVRNSLLLIDSGGQYPDGTTDITRTVAVGTPTAEMKDRFTRVLKGHIALAMVVFPEGTTGSQLDALARQYLWQEKIDYDHGTGHGVGSYLSVHEGPQRISKRGGDAALLPGMVVSNEPGYYKAGEYGIRIESLVAVKSVSSSHGKRYFGFETITLVPLDTRLIDKKLLSAEEKKWLQDYHKKVYEAHQKKLNNKEKEWLKSMSSS